MTGPGVEVLVKHPDIVGENPLWHPQERRLYWTDNRSQRVYRLDPATGAVETVVQGYSVYAFTFQTDGSLLLFMDRIRVATPTNEGVRVAIDGLPGEGGARFNDVLADKNGRVLCGTVPMESGAGALYSMATDGTPTRLVEGMGMPNGMGFTPDDHGLYVTDTRARRITLYDYDLGSGAIANGRTFVDFSGGEGSPDGITVDAEGCVWVALSGGWCVVRYDPSGMEVQRIDVPARKVTSLTFGGDGLDTLYITTSSRQSVPGEEVGPEGGALFAFSPGVRGRLDHRSALLV